MAKTAKKIITRREGMVEEIRIKRSSIVVGFRFGPGMAVFSLWFFLWEQRKKGEKMNNRDDRLRQRRRYEAWNLEVWHIDKKLKRGVNSNKKEKLTYRRELLRRKIEEETDPSILWLLDK